ncbi:hypothetical protein ACFVUQ_21670 [Streptomyces cyaneofuscatus]|uniref:hypothetical protein n=1 Tax=Streptomyces cyaneofuscatus TaxID=66883 RepID=UPI0036DB1583
MTSRVQALQDAGEIVDPRAGQLERLKKENADLRGRVSRQDSELGKLTEFRVLAIPRLAAQHDEIERLRSQLTRQTEAGDVVTRLYVEGGPVRIVQFTQASPQAPCGCAERIHGQ